MTSKYKGMTVNERLYTSGLLDKYDNAVKEKDISILENIKLEELSISSILENFRLLEEK